MIYDIVIEPEALSDLYNIKSYIAKQDSITKANNFLNELKNKIKSLDNMPQRTRKSYYTDDVDAHDLIYKGYTIVYKIILTVVHILTIFKQRNYQLS